MASAVTPVAQTPSCSTTTTLWSRAIANVQADEKLEDILKSITQQIVSSQPPQDIASTVLTKIRQRELEIENKKWSVSFGSKKLVISDCYSKVVGAVLRFKDLGSALAGLDAKAGTPWACTVAMLELSLADFKQHELLAKALGAITPLLPVYAVLESEIAARKDPSLKDEVSDRVVDLYTKILYCQLLVLKYFRKRSPARSLQSVFKPEDWQARIDDIHKADADCQRIISSLQFQNDRLGAEELTHIRKWQQQQDERERSLQHREQTAAILRWLCPNNPAADHASLLERTGTDHQFAGRGEWLFSSSQYQNWSNTTSRDNSILWIKGSMGTGKTTLATLIVEQEVGRRILNSDDSLAMFYCIGKASDSSANDYVTVLGALIGQLAWSAHDGRLHSSVTKAFEDRRQGGHEPTRPSLRLCEDMFVDVVANLKDVTIIIDALDESNDPDEVLGELESLVANAASATVIRLCFTSRRDVRVKGSFPDCLVIDVDSTDRAIDMEFYIRQTVESKRARLLLGRDTEDKVIERLCAKSHGMFRWVQLQLAILYHPKKAPKTRKAVEDVLSRIDSSPSSDALLTTAYDDIMDLNASHEADQSRAITCYRVILALKKPCSFQGLSLAVSAGTDEDIIDPDTIKELTANILLEDKVGFIKFVHFSARSYLLDKIDAGGQKMFSSEACHAETAIICLTNLSRSIWNVSKDYNYYSKTVADNEDVAVYSGLWWGEHAALSYTDICAHPQLESVLSSFLSVGGKMMYRWQRYLSRSNNHWEYNNRPPPIGRKLKQCMNAPPLTVACAWGLSRIVDMILNDKTQQSQIYEYNDYRYEYERYKDSAIMVASRWGLTTCIDLLVSKLRNLHNEEELRWYLNEGLFVAASYIQLEAMKQLLRMGADVDAICPIEGSTPLQCLFYEKSRGASASSSTILEAAKVLLEFGGDPNARGTGGWRASALEFACRRGDADLVKLLLSYKAEPPGNAMEIAASRGHLAIVKMLFDAGVDPRYTRALGCAVEESSTDMINFLVDKGCDMNGMFGKRPLLIRAIESSDLVTVQLLLARGADIGCTCKGMNALEYARCELADAFRPGYELEAERHRPIVDYLEQHPYFVALEAEVFHNLFDEDMHRRASEASEGDWGADSELDEHEDGNDDDSGTTSPPQEDHARR